MFISSEPASPARRGEPEKAPLLGYAGLRVKKADVGPRRGVPMNEYSARNYTSFAAMDVHARSITVATLDTKTGEVTSKRLDGCPGAPEVMDWVARHTSGKTLYAYESGPTKFELCRAIRAAGFDCGVAAVSTLGRSRKQRAQKTDASDARALLSDISGQARGFSWCWVPSPEAEQARDLCRLWRGSVDDLAASRQAVSSFLLGRGIVWNERTDGGNLRTTWTRAYGRWLDEVRDAMCPADAGLLSSLRERVDDRKAYADGLRARVIGLGRQDRWRPYVDSISCLMGVGPETALLAAAEFDDFSRFRSGRRVRNWLGTTPSEHSSGERGSRGGITKGGPTCLRRCLIEGLSSISGRKTATKSLRRGQEPVAEAHRVARQGNRRLLARYRTLADAGKDGNRARVAVASEEACWIWRVGLEVAAAAE
jgi:transposase